VSLCDFSSHSLWVNVVLFGVSAAVIWAAGTKLEHYLDAIAVKTQLKN
jgi:hypothetical protein